MLTASPVNPEQTDLYTNGKTRYPGDPTTHLMFPTLYDRATDQTTIGMATSVDGVAWSWTPGNPVLPVGPPGSVDGGSMFVGTGLVQLPGDRIGLPYGGYSYPHKFPANLADSGICWCTWTRGRLAGVHAATDGEFWTPPVRLAGSGLRVNCRVHPGGSLRVGVTDEDWTEITGLGVSACQPITGDQLEATVSWSGGGRPPVDRAVSLHFSLRTASVFGFEVLDAGLDAGGRVNPAPRMAPPPQRRDSGRRMQTLRSASTSESDAEVVGRLMLDAFPETFTRVFGERDRQAARAVGHGLRAFGSMPNAWLAERDGVCEGLVLVRWDNRSTPITGLKAFLAMARVLGPWRALWVAFHIPPLPPHWLHSREAYISALAISPPARRRGHGSALLDHVIELARVSRLSPGHACGWKPTTRLRKALFRRHGFVADPRRFQWVFNLVRRHFGEIIMTRRLDTPAD